MSNGFQLKGLTTSQRGAIRKYVNELVDNRLRLFEKYLDIDKGFELRPEIKRRLLKKNTNMRKISHEEFWSKASKK